tara:strand:+ start:84 stop:422 length:339 start_codon:yes stop_codon:yes gene_type:complete
MSNLASLDHMTINRLRKLIPDWKIDKKFLSREIKFRNFNQAWGFMTQIALIAEAMNHHPDWSNVYSTVSIRLMTHDSGGLTRLDFELALKINEALGEEKDTLKKIDEIYKTI